jgi:hypothetical protein
VIIQGGKMGVLAKITAIILIVIGLLVMLTGVLAGLTGLFRMGNLPSGISPYMPMMQSAGLGFGISLLVGGVIFGQGLMLAAVGEALYLISNIARNTGLTPPRPL